MKAKRPNLQERKKAYFISNAGKLSALTKSQVMSRDAVSRMFAESVRQHMKPIKGYDLLAIKAAEALAEDQAYRKAYYQAHKSRYSEYYHANKHRQAKARSEQARIWYHANKDEIIKRRSSDESMSKRRECNKRESVVARRKIRISQPKNRIVMNQRSRLRDFIRSTGSHVHLRFGCTPDFMRAHIEKQFTEGMTWDNYGEWHIDHIMPCAQFDLSNQMHADICFNWQNLRPLWAKENLSKSDTITHPQLCLPIVV